MGYAMALILGGRELDFPVLPDKLKVKSSGKNEKIEVLELGEVLRLRGMGLREISWKGFFPLYGAAYVTGDLSDPVEAVRAIQAARKKNTAARFLLTGTDLDVNFRCGIASFEYEERGGELGDIYYEIKLTEWVDYSPRRIILPAEPEQPATASEPARAGAPETSSKYTVVAGDCLWSIAQRHYGDGSRYPAIYAANQSTIDGKNKGTGNPKYTIYPGQVFVIP